MKKCLKCLNIGSGNKPIKSTKKEKWINLDKSYHEGVDVMWDCSRGLPFNENTFDRVLMSHVIEHLTEKEIEYTFAWLFRVCKDKAEIAISTPHWSHASSWGDFSHEQHLSEYVWEHLQSRKVKVPSKKEKIFMKWQFNIKKIELKNGELRCIYVVNKSKNWKPTKIRFEDSAKVKNGGRKKC